MAGAIDSDATVVMPWSTSWEQTGKSAGVVSLPRPDLPKPALMGGNGRFTRALRGIWEGLPQWWFFIDFCVLGLASFVRNLLRVIWPYLCLDGPLWAGHRGFWAGLTHPAWMAESRWPPELRTYPYCGGVIAAVDGGDGEFGELVVRAPGCGADQRLPWRCGDGPGAYFI